MSRPRRVPLFLPVLFGAALLLSLTACDSGGSSDDGDGSPSFDNAFSLTVSDSSGATNRLDGFSYFATGEDPESGERGFALYFLDDEDFSESAATSGFFGIAVRLSERPAPGQYAVSPDDASFDRGESFIMILYENLSSTSATFYEVASGTIDITRSGDDRVDADISLQAREFSSTSDGETQQRTVTIDGSVRAPGVSSLFGTGFLN